MMKTYYTNNALRMVGKAWQIRAVLKQYADSGATLQQFLAVHSAEGTMASDARRA